MKAQIYVSSLGEWRIVSFNDGFLAGFSYVFLRLLEPDLHTSVAFFKTRVLQPHSPSSSTPATGSIGHVGRRCSTRGLHAPESLLLLSARDGHASPFLAVHGGGWGQQWSIYGWVVPVTARVLHKPLSLAHSAAVSSAGSLFLDFFFFIFLLLCCIFLLFFMYNMHVYCSNFIEILID
jgi:hypothetical protein